MSDLSVQRRFISPQPGDTVETIAARELSDMDLADAVSALTSWNLHVFLMRQPHGLITGSDVIFVEAPLQGGAEQNMMLMPDQDG